MAFKIRKFCVIGAKLVVLGTLVWLVWTRVDLRGLWVLMKNVRPGYFLVSLAAMFFIPTILALRLAYVSGVGLRQLVLCIVKSYFFNNLFVGQVGGDLYKIYFLSTVVGEKKRAVAFVAGDRLIGLTGLLMISLLAIALGREYFTDPRVYRAVGIYLGCVAVVFAGLFLIPRKWFNILQRVSRIRAVVAKIDRTLAYARKTVTSKLLLGLLYSAIAYGLLILGNILAMKALGLKTNIAASMLYIPVISIAVMTLPLSFNGLGIRESLFVLFFGMAGFTNEEGLAMAAVSLVGILLVSLVGGLLVFVTGDSLRAIKAQSEQRINS